MVAALTCLLIILQQASSFAQNKPLFSLPFTLVDNRPFIEVKLNGHSFHFILDCGADYGMDTETAKTLGLKLDREGTQTGAGANEAKIWHASVETIVIGAAEKKNINFLVTDVSEIKNNLHLPYLDGFIGYTFMKDYAVQFDYPNSTINFYDSYSGPSPVQFTLYYGSIPRVNAKIDGHDASVIMDTGDRTAFTLFSHFAKKTGIIKNYSLTDTMVTGYGLGGPIYARRLTLKQIQIGKTVVNDIPSRIPTLKTGAFADTNIDGSIGGGILKQYKFTIDYKKKVLYFE